MGMTKRRIATKDVHDHKFHCKLPKFFIDCKQRKKQGSKNVSSTADVLVTQPIEKALASNYALMSFLFIK